MRWPKQEYWSTNTDVDTAIPWVNSVVHELMPLVMLADRLISPPAAQLRLRQGW